MLKSAGCSICLSINKRTINIYDTSLLHVYENLANFKITDVECWVCYICHTRLRQCHQLQQLAVQTRGLIDDIFQNKIEIKFGAFKCLLELSPSRTKIISNLSNIKQELDRELGFNYYDSALQDQTRSTNETNIIFKQELNVKMELNSDDEMKPYKMTTKRNILLYLKTLFLALNRSYL
ncbi:uncharacterized protein LOC121738219 isoform X3 [Aricia agestis]|uniref:uncharacterized protein LOC121738219 isoform X3 n=1 Tax=Aricia agestis TaxID=91739 RepID=UPI001C20A5BD|nr:uncharacterized protein LOC121738219 isoform X3 [Aricia agestis]